MTRNQLPEGVGKKIVEALKRQNSEPGIKQASNGLTMPSVSAKMPEFDVVTEDVPEENENIENDYNDDYIIEEDVKIKEKLVAEDYSEIVGSQEETDVSYGTHYDNRESQNIYQDADIPGFDVTPQRISVQQEPVVKEPVNNIQPVYNENVKTFNSTIPESNPAPVQPENKTDRISHVKIPYNVAILNNLIATLPAGVNKQTGAQIIRQTIEAMGISMSAVLKEAQELQEQLNGSTRDCMIKIQEYKSSIVQLEQSVQEYQRHVSQVNDLISLFLLTDKK